ncbi:DNA adenine methylase [Chloroflexota bacterium]
MIRFLRYPGGKGKLLLYLNKLFPKNISIHGRYIEPFIGGGSVFLFLQPREAIISDLNQELIDLYKGIRNYPHKVWETFSNYPSGKEVYYQIRDTEYAHKPMYYRAARTLYLNRTCFKGMWRHNPEGKFNVGYGGEGRRWVITHDNIVELSIVFKKATILRSDFENMLDSAQDDDFIFLDPPYLPGEKQMLQAHYINGRFSFEDQVRLAEKLQSVSRRNKIRWMMTNTAHPDVCHLYKDFNIHQIPRGVSSIIGVHTCNSNEVVISNY